MFLNDARKKTKRVNCPGCRKEASSKFRDQRTIKITYSIVYDIYYYGDMRCSSREQLIAHMRA